MSARVSRTASHLRVVSATEPLDLQRLFELYAPYVAKIGLRMLGRPSEIDDFVQDVFLAAHRNLGGLEDPQAVKGWLAGIAVNVARHRLRRRRLWAQIFLDRAPTYLEVAGSDASPEDRLLIAGVYVALDRLPIEQRLAWSVRHLAGERIEDAAALCGCSLATVKRHIALAHRAIREALDG